MTGFHTLWPNLSTCYHRFSILDRHFSLWKSFEILIGGYNVTLCHNKAGRNCNYVIWCYEPFLLSINFFTLIAIWSTTQFSFFLQAFVFFPKETYWNLMLALEATKHWKLLSLLSTWYNDLSDTCKLIC